MLPKKLFRNPHNPLEGYDQSTAAMSMPAVPDQLCVACPGCKNMAFTDELIRNSYVCARCGMHFRLAPRKRIAMLVDEDSFQEMDADMESSDILSFPEYEQKLKNARLDSGEREAVITGKARIDGQDCALFVMNPYFESAMERRLPVVGFTLSGGARMQEGILSLMQMAKTSGAVRRHSDAGLLYIAVLTDPTTGGVTASFAMEADIILAEPGALVGFAGPRVIEQTIHKKLPEGFQRSEFLLKCGFVDRIADRREQRALLAQLLKMHAGRGWM